MSSDASTPISRNSPSTSSLIGRHWTAVTRYAGGRWEILPDDTVRYIRPNGQIVQPAIVAASTLRTSPTWRLET